MIGNQKYTIFGKKECRTFGNKQYIIIGNKYAACELKLRCCCQVFKYCFPILQSVAFTVEANDLALVEETV